MSIFTTIGNFIGGLFGGGGPQVASGQAAMGGLDYSHTIPGLPISSGYNPNTNIPTPTGTNGDGAFYYNGYNPPGTIPYKGPLQGPSQPGQPFYSQPLYTPVPKGGAYSNQPGMTMDPNAGSSNQRGGTASTSGATSTPYIFDKNSSKTYLQSAGLNGTNIDLTGKTEDQARAIVDAQKANQRGQVNANTSAAFADPNSILSTSKKVDGLMLGLDKIKNDTWSSAGTKSEQTKNLLQATAKDLAVDYKTPQELAMAYHNDPVAKASLDKFIQAGGTDQMIGEAINAKTAVQQPTGNNMSTAEYLASINGEQQAPGSSTDINTIVPNDKLIQDRIAYEAKIPDNLKALYFGDANKSGLLQQRIDLAKQNIDLLNSKMSNDESNLRSQANYQIQKNNEELSVAKNTIEQNRISAKNYLVGQLAKLGALQTTSAAAEGVTFLDEKYQKQSTEAESKVRYANQEIEIKLRDAINDIESKTSEKIQSVKEDLSKDQKDVLKEINKAQLDSDKEIFNLSVKRNAEMKKNIEKYTSDSRVLAEEYTRKFSQLVSGGFDPNVAARAVSVKLSAPDQRIAVSIRANDPSAIAYFRSLPSEFQNQWIQEVQNSPNPSAIYSLSDLKKAFSVYKPTKKASGTTTVTETRKP